MFNNDVFQQIYATAAAAGPKFTPILACLFMDQTETKFLRTQSLRPMVGFRYIDAISIFEFMGKENLKNLWQIFITLMPIFNLR